MLSLNPGDTFTRGAYAWFLLNRRHFDESLRVVGICLSLDPLMPLFYGWTVGLHAAVGRLERGIAERDTLVGFLHIYTPWFAPALDHEPRFAAILERFGLADVAAPAS